MKFLFIAASMAAVLATSSAFAPANTPAVFGRPLGLRPQASARAGRSASVAAWSMSARKPIIAGNWKMNPANIEEAVKLAEGVKEQAKTAKSEVILCVPHPYIYPIQQILQGSNVQVSAQSVYFEEKGAFTGAVSTGMIKSIGCKHVLAGHSERRVIFKNDDFAINRKVLKILNDGLDCMLCIGESKEEYEGKLAQHICATQLSKDLKGVTKEQMKRVTIAYEPVWAIGTGLTCDANIAQDVHVYIRTWLAELFDQQVAQETRVLYGGSVTPDTVDELMGKPDIDGCLVGGASLDVAKFGRIINYK